jgi:hypothetical protein
MFLSDLRRMTEAFVWHNLPCLSRRGLGTYGAACGGSMRVWIGRGWTLSDEKFAKLGGNAQSGSNAPEPGQSGLLNVATDAPIRSSRSPSWP